MIQLQCTEGQGFGKNFNPSYHDGGLIGHTAIDESCGYGTEIHSYVAGDVYSIYSVEHPASDGYTAIFTIVNTPLETFEWSVGHVSRIDVKPGDTIKVGQVIGAEGNHGVVYSGNILITPAMQAAGDHRGAHRHVQKRPVMKVKKTSGHMLQNSQGTYRDIDGNYYQIYAYDNGFNGCVDWTQSLFPRNLGIGMSGYDVYLLQKAAILEGCGTYEPTGFFGALTLASVIKLQKKNGIAGTGFCGIMTRSYLNNKYNQI